MMAKQLTPYTNRQGLDIGSDSFRITDTGESAIAKRAASLGDGLFNAGLGALKQQQRQEALDERMGLKNEAEARRIEAKAVQEQERFDSINDEKEFLQFRSRLQQYALEHQNDVGEGAPGYAKGVNDFAEKAYDELRNSGRLSQTNAGRHDLMFERVRGDIVNRSAEFEVRERSRFFGAVA